MLSQTTLPASRQVSCSRGCNSVLPCPTSRPHLLSRAVPKGASRVYYSPRQVHRRQNLTVCAAQVTKVNSEQLQQEITARTCPLVIDFYATWCGPCLLLAKELEKVAEQLGDKVKILKVDTDENPELSNQLRIEGLPTMVFVGTDQSKPAIRTEGLLPAETILTIINEELTKLPDVQPAQ